MNSGDRSPGLDAPALRVSRRAREGGFSFMEIMVVMGIIAVLVGLSVVVVQIMAKKGPKMKTELLLRRCRTLGDDWYSRFGAYPPSDPTKIATVSNVPTAKITRLPNSNNIGIRSFYICVNLRAFGKSADFAEDELTPGDVAETLDKPVEGLASPKLFEILDAYGNPLVYFAAGDYADATKAPPTYMAKDADGTERAVYPKPYKTERGFEQAKSFQLFSMGPDGEPNTEDDLKSWE